MAYTLHKILHYLEELCQGEVTKIWLGETYSHFPKKSDKSSLEQADCLTVNFGFFQA